MKNSKRAIYILSFLSMILLAGMLNSCQQDEFAYAKVDDLFLPKFVLDKPKVESNNVTMVWYKVNDAVSYTVELHLDNYHRSLYKSYTITESQIFIEDIPYKTQFHIRLRANHANPAHNSQWAYTTALTEERPAYAQILKPVQKVDFTETEVTAKWVIDPQNPVDSISVEPGQNKELPSIGRKLTSAEISKGEATLTGLEKNTLYNLNVFDNNKPKRYDKPYNQVTFRTAGPSEATIVITNGMDLDAILRANNEDPAIPEGTEYFLEAGSLFKITPFAITKGFKLIGSTEGERPQIEMTGNWNIAEGSYLSSLVFGNIRFYQIIDASYFFNSGTSWTIGEVSFYNCVFNQFKRGFWRHQGNGKYKEIGKIDMQSCTFDQVGGHSGTYGTFVFGSAGADNVKEATFSNCTYMRDNYQTTDRTRNFKNLFDYGASTYPIRLTFENVSIYDYAYNRGLIYLGSAVGSTLIFKNVLLASPCGKVVQSIGANSTTEFSNNYTTTDYLLGAGAIKGTELGISAQNLFVNPAAGDLTIKDANSPIVTNKVGDTRWLPK
ncbi:DUF5123 domain-containing protein [Flavobacterium limi]|uniref:DUF5123 domain-containing protein n=1 Tax=Flavobacterium limi TaxID=2045105 RepID=A0ABQ1TXZ9_9FLAO|nr:DUF5123 domain-containing protein [Flavobacterium limi]GGF05765.1 hypothetical protein GCM10011518_13740 [Flavobacterium limi]